MSTPMDFIHTAPKALPDSLCDELIARFESHPGKQAGITTSGVALARKSSLDLTMENFPDLQEIRQRVLNITLEHLADYFMRYPFFGSVNPSVRDPVTGATIELTMANRGNASRETVKMLLASLFRCGVINIQKYTAGSGGYPH